MIKKEDCLPETSVIVNNKATKWNSSLGTKINGLIAFVFDPNGVLMGDEVEIKPDTILLILSRPKNFNESGNQVKFRIKDDESNTVYSSWWICFKHKVDKC
jgi:hypothetical protein